MTKQGKHPERALTAIGVRNTRKPGRYADGNGLYLVVEPSGSKRWILRTIVQGKRRDMGLGSVRLVPLAEARELATRYRRIAREGGDPIEERNAIGRSVPSFAEASRKVHAGHGPSWRNPKHRQQWINTLETYAFPTIGHLPVSQIGTPEVLGVLSPIWLSKPETARRVRQRIGTVLDWAYTAGHRTGENPVRTVTQGLPKQIDRPKHHAALLYREVPQFIGRLRGSGLAMPTRLAFEFLVLTASRTNEVRLATWREIDFETSTWTRPAEHMKAKREHRVPLTERCLEILKEATGLRGGQDLVFPGLKFGEPLSDNTFEMAVRRLMPERKITTHGFRSSFRDWAAECTSFSREVCEAALAHSIADKTEAAYRRGDLFQKRRTLMVDWSLYNAVR